MLDRTKATVSQLCVWCNGVMPRLPHRSGHPMKFCSKCCKGRYERALLAFVRRRMRDGSLSIDQLRSIVPDNAKRK
jgi:hypothetical protein